MFITVLPKYREIVNGFSDFKLLLGQAPNLRDLKIELFKKNYLPNIIISFHQAVPVACQSEI